MKACHKSYSKSNYRVKSRMITFDHSYGFLNDIGPLESKWDPKYLYVLKDASKVIDVVGKSKLIQKRSNQSE